MPYFDKCHTFAELKDRYIELAQTHHPDKGGDVREFTAILDERERTTKRWQRPVICQPCGGKGKQSVAKGFRVEHSTCPACQGSGKFSR